MAKTYRETGMEGYEVTLSVPSEREAKLLEQWEEVFPTLTDAQIERILTIGEAMVYMQPVKAG